MPLKCARLSLKYHTMYLCDDYFIVFCTNLLLCQTSFFNSVSETS